MKVGSIAIARGNKTEVYILEDGRWSGPDKDLAEILQGQYGLVDRSPAAGYADWGHIEDMARLMGGEATLEPLPEDDKDTVY